MYSLKKGKKYFFINKFMFFFSFQRNDIASVVMRFEDVVTNEMVM